MNERLTQLLLRRHLKLILFVVAAIVSLHLFSVMNSVQNWNANYDSYNEKAEKEYYKSIKEDAEETDITPASYTDYKNDRLLFFTKSISTENSNRYYSNFDGDSTMFATLLFALAGFLLFMLDLNTSFTQLLFQSSFSKKEIYMKKIVLLLVPLIISDLFSKILTIVLLQFSIPAPYFNATMIELIPSIAASTLFSILLFFVGVSLGILIGKPIYGLITLVGFLFSLSIFSVSCFDILTYFSTQNQLWQAEDMSIWVNISKNSVSLAQFVFLILLILILAFIGSFTYLKISLENVGNYLLWTPLKRPTFVLFICYTTFTLAIQGIPFGPNLYKIKMENYSWNLFVGNIIFLLLVSTIIGYFVIYQKSPFTRLNFKQKKKLN